MKFDYREFKPKVVYMSMGAYLESYLPTYSGGLEVLAGDILRSCADARLPVVGLIQASSSGYFRQRIKEDGSQVAEPISWEPHITLDRIPETVTIRNEGRDLTVGAERYVMEGITGYKIPVFLLDTNFECNHPDDRKITGMLYGNDKRIQQELVLGQAGVKLMRKLGYDGITTFHMNEGHAAFSTLELLAESRYNDKATKDLCVFTTHTPVDAGHDRWDYHDVGRIVGDLLPWHIKDLAGHDHLNMTRLALGLSRYVNAVSRKHAEVCRSMDIFKGFDIDYITNGVHPSTWTGRAMADLYDDHFREWRLDPRGLEGVIDHVPDHEILDAKEKGKRHLIGWINAHYPVKFEQNAITIVWARRFAAYKRPDLILREEVMETIYSLADKYGKLQILFAGKPHPMDGPGNAILQKVVTSSHKYNSKIKCMFIEGYDTKISKRLLAGADLWLNNPRRPLEASGTSGMKALFNGTLNLSTFDGWVIEGHEIDPKAMFIVGPKLEQVKTNPNAADDDKEDALGLKDSLTEAATIYYTSPQGWAERIKRSIRLAPYFGTGRVVGNLGHKAWDLI